MADNIPDVVLVRDTKDREGGTLHFTPETWQAFVNLAKHTGPVG
ncbi:DUF397 domain-containing protein [Micromonospora sp. NPDC092111]